jgi:hypothetical protein
VFFAGREAEPIHCITVQLYMKHGFPFHSSVRGIGLADVYHTNAECPIARSIEESYRIVGKGLNRPHCTFCAILDEERVKPHLLNVSPAPSSK